DRETAMDRFAESLRHPGQPIRAEFRIRHQDGSWRWIDSMFRNLLADPSVQAVVSNYRDVTDRKEAEEAQGRARVELELRYRWAKEEFGTSQEQLRASAGRLLAFHEGERARLAREIHEDLGQMLAALKLESAYLASGSPEDEASRLEAARTMSELAVSAIHSVRRIATDLRPSILDHLGLVAALKWQAEEFEHRTDIACEFVQGQAEIPLATEARTTVFRIFQETMSNIARHAHATRVRIHLREEAGNLWLTVADNGRGIAEQEIARLTSLGLFGMREQAHLLGGQVSIVGQAGEGTTVTLQIPLGRANSVELSEEPP
ncbi:MAG TPA: ATP-binding protein, partial [Candidatus Acidoferrum sp.]|nr:ATP-binding protein [Candidatus Acidoferrum sp.]